MAISTYQTELLVGATSYTTPSTDAKDRSGTVVPIYDFPDMGSDPETIDVTTLGDSQYVYIAGIKGSSALTFNANYDATTFGNLNSMSGTKKCFLTLQDGCYLSWEGTVSVRIAGGGVNEKVSMAITIVPSKEISYNTKPAEG